MKIQLEERAFGLCLLTFLVSCGTGQQPLLHGNRPERVTSLSVDKDTVPVLSRQEEIPLMQLDASAIYAGMINYITPEPEVVVARQITEKLTAYIAYPPDGIAVDLRYGNNRAEIEKLKERLLRLLGTDNQLQSIHLTGYASPDGNTGTNERLAGNRAIQFKDYLQKQLRLSDKNVITIDWVGEDWDGLRKVIAASDRKYAPQVLAILDDVADADSRRKQIKLLAKGAVYKDIEKSFFVRLRRMELNVTLTVVASSVASQVYDLSELAKKAGTDPDGLTCDELLQVATLYRPGTEQYREVYELAAYRYPDNRVAQLNAAAASLALGDREAAAYFLQQASDDPRSWNNLGVLALMKNDPPAAISWFRKSMPQNPRLARHNIRIAEGY